MMPFQKPRSGFGAMDKVLFKPATPESELDALRARYSHSTQRCEGGSSANNMGGTSSDTISGSPRAVDDATRD